jgi:hypothetical protein
LVFVKAIVIALGKRKRNLGNGVGPSLGRTGSDSYTKAWGNDYFTSQVQHKTGNSRKSISALGFWAILPEQEIPARAYLQSSKKSRCLIWQAVRVPCLFLCHSMRRKNLCEIRGKPLS